MAYRDASLVILVGILYSSRPLQTSPRNRSSSLQLSDQHYNALLDTPTTSAQHSTDPQNLVSHFSPIFTSHHLFRLSHLLQPTRLTSLPASWCCGLVGIRRVLARPSNGNISSQLKKRKAVEGVDSAISTRSSKRLAPSAPPTPLTVASPMDSDDDMMSGLSGFSSDADDNELQDESGNEDADGMFVPLVGFRVAACLSCPR